VVEVGLDIIVVMEIAQLLRIQAVLVVEVDLMVHIQVEQEILHL
jgi:hypothetical protein